MYYCKTQGVFDKGENTHTHTYSGESNILDDDDGLHTLIFIFWKETSLEI